jgi:flavorubredoxin
MAETTAAFGLVERKKYDDKLAHEITSGIWWIGYVDPEEQTSHNPYLIIDGGEGALINPGSRADDLHRITKDKSQALCSPDRLAHIIVLHNEPQRCAALPLFARTAGRNIRIYAPKRIAKSLKHLGERHPIIALDDGDGIILKSGRTLQYFDTPHLPCIGSGFLFDAATRTIFSGNFFECLCGQWNLFAPPNGWETPLAIDDDAKVSKKAFLHALNKIERLSPERICPHYGPIIEEEIDKYLAAVRDRATDR